MDEQGNPTSAWEFEKLSPEAQARLIARDHQEWSSRVTPAVDPRIDRSKLSADVKDALAQDADPLTIAQRAALLTPTDPRPARQVAEEAHWKGQPMIDDEMRNIIATNGWK